VAAPLRGTQSLVGQMGWVWERPKLTLIEIGWRWLFGAPFLIVCWMQAQRILAALPLESAGLANVDAQNPWLAAVQFSHAAGLYQPHITVVLQCLTPIAALAWVIVSGVGRSLVYKRLDPSLPFRPVGMIFLQAAWLVALGLVFYGWLQAMAWVTATHIEPNTEPDLIGYSFWAIFLSLGFFTLWAFVSWPLLIAPLLLLKERRSAISALTQTFTLGKTFINKLVEINLVMGIVNLALIVLSMVLSAAPLPFSDELGPDALHVLWGAATVFYLVANDYFQIVRIKGFLEFWKMFRETGTSLPAV